MVGTGAAGSACSYAGYGVVQSPCAAGLLCGVAYKCASICDYASGSSSCGPGTACLYTNTCESSTQWGTIAIDQDCTTAGNPCGVENGRYAGLCSPITGGMKCKRTCNLGGTCASGTCTKLFANDYYGVCI